MKKITMKKVINRLKHHYYCWNFDLISFLNDSTYQTNLPKNFWKIARKIQKKAKKFKKLGKTEPVELTPMSILKLGVYILYLYIFKNQSNG